MEKYSFSTTPLPTACTSCGDTFDSEECVYCVTQRIQVEELFHAENIWYNTGQQNVYMTAAPLLLPRYETNFLCGGYNSTAKQKRMVFGRKSCRETLPGLQQKKQRWNA